jgi:hypothetical protein
MTSERLNELVVAKPFQPFDIRLADGRAIRVQHPEFIARSPSGRTAVVFQPDDSMTIVDVFLAVSLDPVARGKSGSKRRS